MNKDTGAPDVEDLVVRFWQDDLPPDQQLELATLIETDEEARCLFASYARLEGAVWHLGRAGCLADGGSLAGDWDGAADGTGSPRNPRDVSTSLVDYKNRWSGRLRVALSLVGGAIAAVFLIWFVSVDSRFVSEQEDAFARVDRTVGVLWEDAKGALKPGDTLGAHLVRIGSGLVDIRFSCGARVILEGPAEFEVVSSTAGFARRGKLRSIVPAQARGFTIGTPGVDVVDLGTEYGLRIHDSGDTEVHVFDGEVRISATGEPEETSTLVAGNAVRVGFFGQPDELDRDDDHFVGVALLDTVAREYQRVDRNGSSSLKKQLEQLLVEVGLREQEIVRNRDLQQARVALDNARRAMQRYRTEHSEFANWEKSVQDKRHRLDTLVRELYTADPDIRENRQLRKELTDRLAVIDQRRAMETQKQELRRRQRQRKAIVQARRSIDRDFAELKRQWLRNNVPVRRAKQELVRARKELYEVAGDEYRSLQRALSEARSHHRKMRKRLFDRDDELRTLRAQKRVVQMRLRETKSSHPAGNRII